MSNHWRQLGRLDEHDEASLDTYSPSTRAIQWRATRLSVQDMLAFDEEIDVLLNGGLSGDAYQKLQELWTSSFSFLGGAKRSEIS